MPKYKDVRIENTLYKVFDVAATLVSALVILVVGFIFCFRAVEVNGASMNDTLQHGDRLLIWAVGYQPSRGDIVVAERPGGEPLIKRVIAVGGDTVKVADRAVYVNGSRISEPYVSQEYPNVPSGMELTVPEGSVFLMGDHRNNSHDSRSDAIGCVPAKLVAGKVIFRFAPLPSFGFVW